MYRTYRTEGIILGTSPHGEANRFLSVLTPDFGLLRVVAQGVRGLNAKMRPHTTWGTLGSYSFVRGREVWRLTNALTVVSFGHSFALRGIFPFAARLGALVQRLMPEEGRNIAVYEVIRTAFFALEEVGLPEALAIERLAVARVLHALGYLSPEAMEVPILSPHYDAEALAWADRHARSLVLTINQSLRATDL